MFIYFYLLCALIIFTYFFYLLQSDIKIFRKFLIRDENCNTLVSERGCMYEVSLLLTCLEENNFEDKNCIPQIKTVNACYEKHGENMRRRNIEQDKVVPVPNSKNFTHKQITYLLRQYPTV